MSVNDCTRSTPVYVVHSPSLLTSSLLILSTRVQWSRNVSLDSLSVGSSYSGDNCIASNGHHTASAPLPAEAAGLILL